MSLDALLLDASSELLLLLDAQTLHIAAANNAALVQLGYTREQLVGKPIGELECALTDIFFWDEMGTGTQPVQAHGSFMKADGEVVDVVKTVRRVGTQGGYFSLRALEQSSTPATTTTTTTTNTHSDVSSHLKATLEATADGILLMDNDGAILNMNRRFPALWQVPQQLLLNHDDAGIVAHIDNLLLAQNDTAQGTRHHSTVLTGAAGVTDEDTLDTLTLKDGRMVECISHPALDGERVIGRVFCYRDVTERQLHEQSLKEARDRAELATQSKGQFLANMSHEIRTPMNAILGMLNLLQSTELTARQLDYARKSEGAAKSLLGLLNDILDFSKVEAGKMTIEMAPVRIDQLLRNLAVVLSANVGAKDIEVLFDIDPALPDVVMGDAMRLQQVLINIGGNAVKFTAKGQVVLSLHQLDATPDAVTVEFAVKDSGIGIAPENQTHIFSGFSQAEGSTTRLFGGTGLGLAISKRLVELMGGEIRIDSTIGMGSTFSFALKLALAHDIPTDLLTPARTVAQSLWALVVDDNDVAGDLTTRMVQSLGWHGEWAHSGAQAMEMIATRHTQAPEKFPFPVIYMDWQMPGMDGWEATRSIRQFAQQHQLPQPTIIMVTAHERETLGQRSETEQDMLDGFLVKPITASMLLDSFLAIASGKSGVRRIAKGRSSKRQLADMRILVVEDNLINQQVADELLSAEGAIVSLAANGRQGADAVAAAAPQFDAVLMDIQMPVLDGYGATRVIRDELGLMQLPIIAMTANAMASDRMACLAAGMDEHIGKPFDIAKLVSLLIRLTGLQVNYSETPADSAQSVEPSSPHDIPGLAVSTALARMSGLRTLYVRTARDFSKILDTFTDELRKHLVSGERKTVLMRLHTIKGNAGTLGATDLAGMAAELESLCKSEDLLDQCLDALDALEACIKTTQHLLAQAVAQLEPQASAAAIKSDRVVDAAQAVRVLRELDALASASDMDVLQRFAESGELVASFPDGFSEQLEVALQALDLDAAHVLCSAMLAQLDLTTT